MKNALKKLKQSSKFVEWDKKNNKSKLAYAFIMVENNENNEWQFGYYNSETNRVATFSVNDSISLNDKQEIFKKPGDKVKCIKLSDVKFGLDEVLKKANDIKEKKYSKELVTKTIAVLQNIDLGQLWNITFITSSFNTINIKIDAKTGKTIKHKLVSLFQFKAG